MKKSLKKVSIHLSYILRHKPEDIGLTLDSEGWADIDELIAKNGHHKYAMTKEEFMEIVKTDEKSRYRISQDGKRVRASQGHSSKAVGIAYEPQVPPMHLYHGTASKNIESILEDGLVKGNRHHVHLSICHETAVSVGTRHGSPVVLKVDAKQMSVDGYKFYLSDNNVWLIDHVPAKYIKLG